MNTTSPDSAMAPVPRGDRAGFITYWRNDFASGVLVFLVALPLSIGIAIASGYPPAAGLFTAVIGGVLTTFLSNAELTIKGPAAGLIVIILGAVTDFGFTGNDPTADFNAYRMALAACVAAGVLQVVFGLVRSSVLGDFFPTTVVHGMLAAIGVIITLKQLPVALGESAHGEPLEILADLPHILLGMNPAIAVIGISSLLILFGLPQLKARLRLRWLQFVPGPLVVLLVAIPLGMLFGLSHDHTYTFFGQGYELAEKHLVPVPTNILQAITTPDFSSLQTITGWKWAIMLALVGSLESLLSAKAIGMLDPWKRKTNLDRDLVAVGIANTVSASIGGLPMISEIVRSKANIDNGARTRFANFWHGVVLLGFVVLLPGLIHRVPLAALAAMLVYTGIRLASPREFVNVSKIGYEQLVIFIGTIVAVLATDLLVGVLIGIGIKVLIHIVNGVPLRALFQPFLQVIPVDDHNVIISAKESAVFSNWIPFKRQIEQLGLVQKNNIVIDLSGTRLVDHSVMEHLHEMEEEFTRVGLSFSVIGLESHRQLSGHPYATRKRGLTRLRRVTIVTAIDVEGSLVRELAVRGASDFNVTLCRMARYSSLSQAPSPSEADPPHSIRVECLATWPVAEAVVEYLQAEIGPCHPLAVVVESIEALECASRPPTKAPRGDEYVGAQAISHQA